MTYPIGKISLIFSSLSRKMCQVSKKSYVVKPDFAMGTIAEILSIGDTYVDIFMGLVMDFSLGIWKNYLKFTKYF